jgi:hypothetical protein
MITREEFEEIEALMRDWRHLNNPRVPADVMTRIFNLHNKCYPEKMEHSRGCGACQARTWSKLCAWYDEHKDEYSHIK